MWDLPGPGLEPMSPALAGGFLTTVPPGKPPSKVFYVLWQGASWETTTLGRGLRVVVKREIGFLPEVESLVPENCPLLRLQRREKSWLQMQKPKLWGFLKIRGADNHLDTTQQEKAPQGHPNPLTV